MIERVSFKNITKNREKKGEKKKWSIEGDFNFKSVAIKVCEKQPVLKGEIYSARKKKMARQSK